MKTLNRFVKIDDNLFLGKLPHNYVIAQVHKLVLLRLKKRKCQDLTGTMQYLNLILNQLLPQNPSLENHLLNDEGIGLDYSAAWDIWTQFTAMHDLLLIQ